MRVAFVLFDGLTALDFVGIYDPLTRLGTMGFVPDLEWELCALRGEVSDERRMTSVGSGLRMLPTRVGEPLEGYDVLVVPGGFGTRRLARDPDFIAWIASAKDCPLKTSVCTGSLLLAAAGFLDGHAATTHPSALNDLRAFPRISVREERVVDDGEVVTAGGVTAAIDLGLHLCRRIAGQDAEAAIRKQMDYQGGAG